MPNAFSRFTQSYQQPPQDVEWVKQEVGKHFPFYEVKFAQDAILFYCKIDEQNLEDLFNDLRQHLSEKHYLPFLRHERGEYILYITHRPVRKNKPLWINIVLLIATIITTVLTGSLLSMGYSDIQSLPNISQLFNPTHLFNGLLYFSLPLMAILFIHEMGHYYYSIRHGLKTSFPYFIPIPPILPGFNIGTFGALISSNDPMPNKKALFDIGLSGPIAGFCVAVPVTIIGILTSNVVPISGLQSGDTVLGVSLLFYLLQSVLVTIPPGFTLDLNAIAFAGWIGLLITSINLLPAGQLDGGHIFRAALGEKQKYVSWVAVLIMIFTGWWFFAFIIILMLGMSHPPPLNDYSPLDTKRRILFLFAVFMLILCFIPFPIYAVP